MEHFQSANYGELISWVIPRKNHTQTFFMPLLPFLGKKGVILEGLKNVQYWRWLKPQSIILDDTGSWKFCYTKCNGVFGVAINIDSLTLGGKYYVKENHERNIHRKKKGYLGKKRKNHHLPLTSKLIIRKRKIFTGWFFAAYLMNKYFIC